MKRWIKRTLIGLFGASLLVGGLAACSHRLHHHGPMSEADMTRLRERLIDKAGRELALDEAQKTKLGALADALKAQRSALMPGADARADVKAQLLSLVAGPQFDRSQAQALVEAKTSAVRERSPAIVAAMGDFYDSLKPEQQHKLRELMARGRHGWRG